MKNELSTSLNRIKALADNDPQKAVTKLVDYTSQKHPDMDAEDALSQAKIMDYHEILDNLENAIDYYNGMHEFKLVAKHANEAVKIENGDDSWYLLTPVKNQGLRHTPVDTSHVKVAIGVIEKQVKA